MKLTERDVWYVAGLANLNLTSEEIEKFSHDLNEILTHMESLNEVDTAGVEPMAQVLYEADATATWRTDEERPSLGTKEALANAPVSGSGYFKVPKVIER